MHEATFPKFFSLPAGVPDSRMIRDPIWSTWAEYYTAVNDSRVLDLARTITEYGFNNSQVCGWRVAAADEHWAGGSAWALVGVIELRGYIIGRKLN